MTDSYAAPEDVCDRCAVVFRCDVGHWCPTHREERFRWQGERMHRCEASKIRIVVGLLSRYLLDAGVSLDIHPGTSALNGWACFVIPPPLFVAIVTRMHEGWRLDDLILTAIGAHAMHCPWDSLARAWTIKLPYESEWKERLNARCQSHKS